MPRAPVIPFANGLQAAFDLFDRELRLKRKRLRRRFPKASRWEIEKKVGRWLGNKPELTGPDFIKVPKSKWPKEWRTPPKPARGGNRKA